VCGIGDEAAVGGTEQVAVHRQLGLRGVELRTVNGRWLHELGSRELGELGQAVAEAGLVVPVVDTPVGGWATTAATDLAVELDVLADGARAAAVLGCRRLRVMSYPNDGRAEPAWRAEALRRMRVLATAAGDLGVQLLHENCHGWVGGDPQRTLELLAAVDSAAVRLLFDTGNGVAHGYDGQELLRAVLPYVAHVHVKDGVRVAGGDTVFGLPGTGQARVADCVALLEWHGYRGWYSLEPHIAVVPHRGPDQDAGLAEREAGYRGAVTAFRALLDDHEPAVTAETR
jgi:sugar phosphate isomerase/epimerase